ncbi:MAG: putative ABC transporter permease [Promethearchaeota archaeon CR_4]|nr:MAG: putative ABC transporter permease [Candidatus Lokiarchaeota archaeon CR_4]
MKPMYRMENPSKRGVVKGIFKFNNAWKIFVKDWKEMRHNRQLFWSVLLFPLIIAIGLPLMMMGTFIADGIPATEIYEIFKVEIGSMMKLQFMLIPVIVCAMIAGDSLAGEKERKTAETLIVLPVTAKELFIGKVLAALIPALLYAVIGFAIMGILSNLLVLEPILAGNPPIIFADLSFWVIAFLLSPIFVLVMVQVVVAISARLSTAKSAQQVSMIFAIPIFGVMFISFTGPGIISDVGILLGLSAILLGIALVLANFGSRAINKERFIATL